MRARLLVGALLGGAAVLLAATPAGADERRPRPKGPAPPGQDLTEPSAAARR